MATPRRSHPDWRPWKTPPDEELMRRPLSSSKRLYFTNIAIDNKETPEKTSHDQPMEDLVDSLDGTMPFPYSRSI